MIKNLRSQRNPLVRHVRYLESLEKQTVTAYRLMARNLIINLLGFLRTERLVKSNKKKGWTGEAPKIEVNLRTQIAPVIEDYIKAMEWVLFGEYAGNEAKEAAERSGLIGKILPDTVTRAYNHSINAHRQYYREVMGKPAPMIPKDLMDESISFMKDSTFEFTKTAGQNLKSDLMGAVLDLTRDFDSRNLDKVYKDRETQELMSRGKIINTLNKVAKKHENKWAGKVTGDLGVASASGTHQAMREVFGRNDDSMRIVYMTMEDNRVTDFCHNNSFDAAGNYRYYKMSDFKPAGYNLGRKRKDWKLSIVPGHYNCRSWLVYVPPGFMVERGGRLIKKK